MGWGGGWGKAGGLENHCTTQLKGSYMGVNWRALGGDRLEGHNGRGEKSAFHLQHMTSEAFYYGFEGKEVNNGIYIYICKMYPRRVTELGSHP